jgi:hypothetical protein
VNTYPVSPFTTKREEPVLAGGVITLLIPLVLVAPFMRHFRLSLLDGSTRG